MLPDESFPVGKANLAVNWRPCILISIYAKENTNEAEFKGGLLECPEYRQIGIKDPWGADL